MSSATALPANLRDKLAAVARRLRLWRAVRGLSWVLLVLVLTGGVALLADAWLDLSAGVRVALFIVWIGLGILTTLFSVVQPLRRSLEPDALAAVIETRFPQLGERLTTAVELAGAADEYHGSPRLVALLIDETEARTQRLNFLRAFPAGVSGLLAAAALLAVLLATLPAFFWPDQYGKLRRRFFLALEKPATVIPYTLEVAPGDAVVARGRPLLLRVQVRPLQDNTALPSSCTLVQTDSDGQTIRRRMIAERSDAFALKLDQIPGDFRYHVEAGEAVSASYQISAVEPVELAADSPTVTITPPEYAQATVATGQVQGCVDLVALQHSRIIFTFRFTRPAVAAMLEWKPSQGAGGTTLFPLALSADGREGRLELPANVEGTYKVVLEAEHGIRTELEPRSVMVKLDQPPAFVRVSGGEEMQMVQPYEVLPLAVDLADDVGVNLAAVEYQVNEGTPIVEPLSLEGRGTRQAKGSHSFSLAGKVKEGDVVRYRLKAADNRHVPEAKLGPNVVYHPPETAPGKPRWRTLKIARQAAPLKQQEIAAQHDEVQRRLEAIQKKLGDEQTKLQQLRTDAKDQPALKPPQTQDLAELRRQNQAAEHDLRELARDLTETPALQPIAETAQEVADQEMNRGARALQQAQQEAKADLRERALQQADKELTDARRKLDELRRQNDRLAKARKEQAELETLAERQQQLADRTDRPAPERAKELEREQGELAQELRRQAEQNENVRQALDAARADQAKRLAAEARDLAEAEKQLAEAERDRERRRRQEQLADLARQQRELADKARQLAVETRQSSEAARTQPLQPDDTQKATEALQKGDAQEALRHQDRAARELSRLANDLQRGADLTRDPREAARQLARLQENLRQRMNAEVGRKEAKEPLADRLAKLRPEQEAIHRAAERLAAPKTNAFAKADRAEAAARSGDAAEALRKGDHREAETRMKITRQALERLAGRLPALEQRQEEALAEVRRLRREQDQVARQADQAVQEVENELPGAAPTPQRLAPRLTEAARRQAEIAGRLEKLDAPTEEARRGRVQEALAKALHDLKEARPQDVKASQQAAQRQLERLEQALSGTKPVDEKAQELARRQRELAEEADRLTAKPQPTKAKASGLQQRQEQIAQETQALAAPEAPKEKAEAATATQKAEDRLRKKPADPDTLRQMRNAAESLERLARQLQGQDTKAPTKPPAEGTPPGALPDSRQAEQARQLARQQRDLRSALKSLAEAPAPSPPGESARRQQEIAQQTNGLKEKLRQLAQEMARVPPAQQAMQRAAQSSQQAQTAMHEAQKPERQAQADKADQARQQAVQALHEAAHQAEQAAQEMVAHAAPPGKGQPNPQTGKELQKAQGQMGQAQKELAQGQARSAQTAMQQAAQALAQAARQLASPPPQGQANMNPQPNKLGALAPGQPDLRLFDKDLKKYAGKTWGELPGELRTKIIQDMQARYGDDYARIIKLYFEQLADKK